MFLGSSGVGKSTIINDWPERSSWPRPRSGKPTPRGRHTTSRRELLLLPGGALLIDTPGVREFRLWEADGAVDDVFSDIAALAAGCRYADCVHVKETGCAVREAVETGRLPAGRYESYLKLRKELASLESRQREKPGADKKAVVEGNPRGRENLQEGQSQKPLPGLKPPDPSFVDSPDPPG